MEDIFITAGRPVGLCRGFAGAIRSFLLAGSVGADRHLLFDLPDQPPARDSRGWRGSVDCSRSALAGVVAGAKPVSDIGLEPAAGVASESCGRFGLVPCSRKMGPGALDQLLVNRRRDLLDLNAVSRWPLA